MKKAYCTLSAGLDGFSILSVGEIEELPVLPSFDEIQKMTPEEQKRIVSDLQTVKGNAEVYKTLAYCFDLGISVPRSVSDAKAYYQLAYTQKQLDDHEIAVSEAENREIRMADSVSVYADGAEKLYPVALFLCSRCFRNGLGFPPTEAFADFFEEAAYRQGITDDLG